jgi:hypothetical protein
MDPFEYRLRGRIQTLEAAAPVIRRTHSEETRIPRRRALWFGAVAVAVAAAAVAVAVFAWPASTEASTRSYALDPGVTVTVRDDASWTGTVDQATAETAIRQSLEPGENLHVTAAWKVAGTLSVKSHGWSISMGALGAKPLDVWVIEFAGTSGEGWPETVFGVVDAHTGLVQGGGVIVQFPVGSLGQDPNKPTPATTSGVLVPSGS